MGDPLVLGVDPGAANGAAVLLQGRRVLAWWSYCKLKRKSGDVYRLSSSLGTLGYPLELPRVWGCGLVIGREARAMQAQNPLWSGMAPTPRLYVCLEGLFVPRAKRSKVSPQMAIALAESAGQLEGGIGLVPSWRPLATDWRHVVLGLRANTAADRAEDYAITAAGQMFDWPDSEPVPSKAERGAVAEAVCLARYGLVMLEEQARREAAG